MASAQQEQQLTLLSQEHGNSLWLLSLMISLNHHLMTNEMQLRSHSKLLQEKNSTILEITVFIFISSHLGKCTDVGLSGIYHLLIEQIPNTIFDEYLKKYIFSNIYITEYIG